MSSKFVLLKLPMAAGLQETLPRMTLKRLWGAVYEISALSPPVFDDNVNVTAYMEDNSFVCCLRVGGC